MFHQTTALIATGLLLAGALAIGVESAAFAPPHYHRNRRRRPVAARAGPLEGVRSRSEGGGVPVPDAEETRAARPSRREALSSALSSLVPVAAALGSFGASEPARARDELFKPNPLTNPVLERVRIWEQAEADNVKYGGELAPGSPKGREAYAKLLVPILSIQRDLETLDDLVHEEGGAGLDRAAKILDQPQFRKIQFKKIFNAFADNIYYADPDRANAYLGGGAVPKTEQSLAYLLRNDVLTNVEALQAEVAYLIKERKSGGSEALETEDLFQYVKSARDGMVRYLDLVPPGELKMGRELFLSGAS